MANALPAERRDLPVSIDVDNPLAIYIDTAIVARMQKLADDMAKSQLVPKHLQGRPGDCWLIVAQALRWQMDPFAVAQCSYVTQGKLGYEGKLIAGVINSSGKLVSSLNYKHTGEGDNRRVVVSGILKTDPPGTVREVDGTVGRWKTGNEKWKSMPDQMLSYRGAREWARRHMPEAVLGIAAEEEVTSPRGPEHARDITPVPERRILSTDADAFERAAAGVTGEIIEPEAEEAEPVAEEEPAAQVPTEFTIYRTSGPKKCASIEQWVAGMMRAIEAVPTGAALEQFRDRNVEEMDRLRDAHADHVDEVGAAIERRLKAL